MSNLTIRQLRYFQALARHRHFGRAAEVCAISQPALSVQIKELEQTLGATLLERGTRRISLTPLGEEFEVRVDEILRAVDELSDLARASREELSGSLRIGIIPTIAPYLLPGIVARLSETHPGLDIRLRETVTTRLIEEIEDGRLDVAIVALPVSEPNLTEVELFSEEFVLVRHEADSDKPVPAAEELSEMRLLLLEEGHCFREQALSFCQMKASPRELLDASSLSTLVQMVGSGIGVTLIPEMAVDLETRSGSVSISRFREPRPTRTVGMIWRKSNPLAAQLMQIADVLAKHGAADRRSD